MLLIGARFPDQLLDIEGLVGSPLNSIVELVKVTREYGQRNQTDHQPEGLLLVDCRGVGPHFLPLVALLHDVEKCFSGNGYHDVTIVQVVVAAAAGSDQGLWQVLALVVVLFHYPVLFLFFNWTKYK